QTPKRKTIGLRVPDQEIVRMLLDVLGEPLMSVTLIVPGSGSDLPLSDPEEMQQVLAGQVDVIIDGGSCGFEPTSVIDLTGETPTLVRQGKGDTSFLATA